MTGLAGRLQIKRPNFPNQENWACAVYFNKVGLRSVEVVSLTPTYAVVNSVKDFDTIF
jgi:hypothetical protein